MELPDEYKAAVNLGYISQDAAEKEFAASVDYRIDAEDVLQRKAFMAGFMWMHFQMGWSITETDLNHALSAWAKWCEHIEKKVA